MYVSFFFTISLMGKKRTKDKDETNAQLHVHEHVCFNTLLLSAKSLQNCQKPTCKIISDNFNAQKV